MSDTVLAIVATSAAQAAVYIAVLLWRLSGLTSTVSSHGERIGSLELFKDRAAREIAFLKGREK
ncbi:MAG TPA: hypothetical protein VMW51_09740 [Terriglobia bacterium]|nr:hypothetical protein [Terriglobia bacterium]